VQGATSKAFSRIEKLFEEEYTYEEFTEIVRRLLKKRFQINIEHSEKIAHAVWNRMRSKDVRDAINMAKLTKSATGIDWLVEVQMKYGINENYG